MNWWSSFFDLDYARRYLQKVDPQELAFLRETLNLESGARVFDQCCGIGRLSQAAAQWGLTPVGVDSCGDYLREARRCCPEGNFVQADALEFVAQPACAGGFNFYSSFGYSPDDQKNRQMLRCAFDSLLPGSVFVLETMNMARVLAEFQPTLEETREDGYRVLRKSHCNWEQGMLEQEWTFHLPDGSHRQSFGQVRMLLPREIGEFLKSVGFTLEACYGDCCRSPLERLSKRLIWVARRP